MTWDIYAQLISHGEDLKTAPRADAFLSSIWDTFDLLTLRSPCRSCASASDSSSRQSSAPSLSVRLNGLHAWCVPLQVGIVRRRRWYSALSGFVAFTEFVTEAMPFEKKIKTQVFNWLTGAATGYWEILKETKTEVCWYKIQTYQQHFWGLKDNRMLSIGPCNMGNRRG